MGSLVPSYLELGGATLPLMVGAHWVGIGTPPEALMPLTYVVWSAVNGHHKDTPLEEISRSGFHEQELAISPIPRDHARAYAVDMLNWRRLSGEWPPEASSFVLETVARQRLAMPRDVVIPLFARLRELRDGIESGGIECKLSDEPVPPPRPLTPELEEFEFLWGIDKEDARRFAEELYERRG